MSESQSEQHSAGSGQALPVVRYICPISHKQCHEYLSILTESMGCYHKENLFGELKAAAALENYRQALAAASYLHPFCEEALLLRAVAMLLPVVEERSRPQLKNIEESALKWPTAKSRSSSGLSAGLEAGRLTLFEFLKLYVDWWIETSVLRLNSEDQLQVVLMGGLDNFEQVEYPVNMSFVVSQIHKEALTLIEYLWAHRRYDRMSRLLHASEMAQLSTRLGRSQGTCELPLQTLVRCLPLIEDAESQTFSFPHRLIFDWYLALLWLSDFQIGIGDTEAERSAC